ncbi:DUF2059 domain-containing protein [Photobacterium leiognathi]|uniref:DUF2059 domain-containing protein n=1 Tax=Photobacterium leiognathi TaxID=553611 RepID=UPI001EDCCB52|nr:DUF2059 domain-containing protein [Photobacterium leiognathi]MCG3887247.1 DUF2059 domain-containing protein [Photobacterium leiognathi]
MFSKKIIAATLLALSFNVSATTSDIPASKKLLIDKLLAQTGQSAVAVGKQYSDLFTQQMTAILKQSKPDINPKAFDIVEEEISTIMDEEFVINDSFKTMMYPIYSKHFTEDELRKMIEINDTEFGKKLIRVMPLINQEGMLVGQEFGKKLGPKIQQRITKRFKEEGIK